MNDPSNLDEVAGLAEAAGRAILEHYKVHMVSLAVGGGGIGVERKADASPLTAADLAAHEVLADRLGQFTPDVPVLSEESAHAPWATRRTWRRHWLVDPLDGTKEFVAGRGDFTVNVALVEDGVPVLGVVHAPARRLTFAGVPGHGAWREGPEGRTPLRVAAWSEGAPLRVVASRNHRTADLERFLGGIATSGVAVETISVGSALKFGLVAEGRAHLYPRLGTTMHWDSAAGQAVVQAAGGAVHTLDQQLLRYDREDLRNPWFVAEGAPAYPWTRHVPILRES